MNRFKIQLVLTLSMMSMYMPMTASINANEACSTQSSQDIAKNGRLREVKIPNRHRMPSRKYMEYFYDGNGITVTAPERYTRIEISIMEENSMNEISGTLSEENGYYIETGALYGSYTITCTTQDGSVFSGIMTNK